MSPVLPRPLELGADIVMHSATKFIAGHSNVMAGVLAIKGESLAKDLYFLQNAQGSGLVPFDCWLVRRGMKIMVLHVMKQQENAQKIAEFLCCHPQVQTVNYPGLPGHPGRAIHDSQAKGAGSVLSFFYWVAGFVKAYCREYEVLRTSALLSVSGPPMTHYTRNCGVLVLSSLSLSLGKGREYITSHKATWNRNT